MPGDAAALKAYGRVTDEMWQKLGPVHKVLALIPWFREIILQDAVFRLQLVPFDDSGFHKQHRLFQRPLFRDFFFEVFGPEVIAQDIQGRRQRAECKALEVDMAGGFKKLRVEITADIGKELQRLLPDGAGNKRQREEAEQVAHEKLDQAMKVAKVHIGLTAPMALSMPKSPRGYARPGKALLSWPKHTWTGFDGVMTAWTFWRDSLRQHIGADDKLKTAGWMTKRDKNGWFDAKAMLLEMRDRSREDPMREKAMLEIMRASLTPSLSPPTCRRRYKMSP